MYLGKVMTSLFQVKHVITNTEQVNYPPMPTSYPQKAPVAQWICGTTARLVVLRLSQVPLKKLLPSHNNILRHAWL
jgi:hypothetical protein